MDFLRQFFPLTQILYYLLNLTVIPMAWLVWKIRVNDLAHIDSKLNDLRNGQKRIEDKLDQHIQWHLITMDKIGHGK